MLSFIKFISTLIDTIIQMITNILYFTFFNSINNILLQRTKIVDKYIEVIIIVIFMKIIQINVVISHGTINEMNTTISTFPEWELFFYIDNLDIRILFANNGSDEMYYVGNFVDYNLFTTMKRINNINCVVNWVIQDKEPMVVLTTYKYIDCVTSHTFKCC